MNVPKPPRLQYLKPITNKAKRAKLTPAQLRKRKFKPVMPVNGRLKRAKLTRAQIQKRALKSSWKPPVVKFKRRRLSQV